MNIYMYHQICYLAVELCIFIVHTMLSLVGKVVPDTQPRLICKLADDTILLAMGMHVMLIWLTLTCLKWLASRTGPYWDTTSKFSYYISINGILRTEVFARSGLWISRRSSAKRSFVTKQTHKGRVWVDWESSCVTRMNNTGIFLPTRGIYSLGSLRWYDSEAWPCETPLSVNRGSQLRVCRMQPHTTDQE
jgi:hypothetical protein